MVATRSQRKLSDAICRKDAFERFERVIETA